MGRVEGNRSRKIEEKLNFFRCNVDGAGEAGQGYKGREL